jgi:hypothetical protein
MEAKPTVGGRSVNRPVMRRKIPRKRRAKEGAASFYGSNFFIHKHLFIQ